MKKYIIPAVILVAIATTAGWMLQKNKPDNAAVKGAIIQTVIYLDVRTDQEWQEGHLSDAVHFDLAKLQQGLLPNLDKSAQLNVYCKSGRRAEEAKNILTQNGFTNVRNAGGFADLQNQGIKLCVGTQTSCN